MRYFTLSCSGEVIHPLGYFELWRFVLLIFCFVFLAFDKERTSDLSLIPNLTLKLERYSYKTAKANQNRRVPK